MTQRTYEEKLAMINQPSGRPCPKCGRDLLYRRSRFGIFEGCSSYPACKGKICAPRGRYAKAEEKPAPVQGEPAEIPCPTPGCVYIAGHDPIKLPCKVDHEDPPTQATEVEEMSKQTDAGSSLWALIAPFARESLVSEDSVRKVIGEEIAKAQVGKVDITWSVNGIEFAKVAEDRPHKALAEILRRLKAGIKNILLVGPAGSGKTTLAESVAKALKDARFASLSCTAGLPEWHLTGRSMPNLQTGQSVYAISQFVDFYERGGVFLLDEVDAADPNVLLALNSALANGHMSIAARTDNPRADRHGDFILICAANTYGQGASRMYCGRNQLDAAFLRRFACAIITVDYDRDWESAAIQNATICARVWKIRERISELGLRRLAGTGELLAVTKMIKSGETLDWAIDAMLEGWTNDERSKVGEAVQA